MEKQNKPFDIFIAYSREDTDILSRLRKSLSILQRRKLVGTIWYDGMIEAGSDWEQSIKDALQSSEIVLLLISSDFIASDYCYGKEMKEALKLHAEGKAIVLPVIGRECLWKEMDFGKLQALPENGKPITSNSWENPDRPYNQITRAIKDLIENDKNNEKADDSNSVVEESRDQFTPFALGSTIILIISFFLPFRQVMSLLPDKPVIHNFFYASDGPQNLQFLPIVALLAVLAAMILSAFKETWAGLLGMFFSLLVLLLGCYLVYTQILTIERARLSYGAFVYTAAALGSTIAFYLKIKGENKRF